MAKLKILRSMRTILDIAALLALILMLVVFALAAGILPPPSPDQLGGDSVFLKYGVRMLLLGIFFAGCGIIGLLFLMARFPRLYKYPVEITPKNIELQYVIAKLMLSANQMICALYISILIAGVYRTEISVPSDAFTFLTASALALCAIVTAVYFIFARKSK